MSKIIVFIYTQMEVDSVTGASRIVKHWQKVQSAQVKKRTLETETPTEEFME